MDSSFPLCSLDEEQGNFQHLLSQLIETELSVCSGNMSKTFSAGETEAQAGTTMVSVDFPPAHPTASCAIHSQLGELQSKTGRKFASPGIMQGEKILIGISEKSLLHFKVWN